MSDTQPKVLFVDDDLILHDVIKMMLMSRFQIVSAFTVEHARRHLLPPLPDFVICDLMMPIENGIELMRYIRENLNQPDLPIVVITATVDHDLVRGAHLYNPVAVLYKPFTRDQLFHAVEQALNHRNNQ